jgi:hypothetical protein
MYCSIKKPRNLIALAATDVTIGRLKNDTARTPSENYFVL